MVRRNVNIVPRLVSGGGGSTVSWLVLLLVLALVNHGVTAGPMEGLAPLSHNPSFRNILRSIQHSMAHIPTAAAATAGASVSTPAVGMVNSGLSLYDLPTKAPASATQQEPTAEEPTTDIDTYLIYGGIAVGSLGLLVGIAWIVYKYRMWQRARAAAAAAAAVNKAKAAGEKQPLLSSILSSVSRQ